VATFKILIELLIKKADEGCKKSNSNFKAVLWTEASVVLKGSEQQTDGTKKTASSCESHTYGILNVNTYFVESTWTSLAQIGLQGVQDPGWELRLGLG
jgi:hypothetical protein